MSHHAPRTPADSTRDVLGGWNLLGDVEPGPTDSLFAARPRSATPLKRTAGASTFDDPADPIHHFALPSDGDDPGAADSLLGDERADPAARPCSSAGRSQHSAPDAARPAPRKGEMIGGFRVVAELGRGAFARVYLAEQIELGNRLVALKVSKAEGEEPQILAQLQHTHIVPIHSVHDDPETGLRLLCMPYLGGANLAQVLEAAGARHTDGTAGGSLVAALDDVSQRYQSHTGTDHGRRSRYSARSVEGSPSKTGLQSVRKENSALNRDTGQAAFPASFGHGSLDRLQHLWGRVTGRRLAGVEGPAKSLDDRDFDQPARQFLRGANTVQASAWIVARLAEGLDHAHGRGLLHRDLKPSNILITGDGTPMLLDFNLSTPSRVRDDEDGERALLGGTLPYMSPEHLDAFSPRGTTRPEAVDERSDIYALGLILFEMLAGEHPFPEPRNRPLLETIRVLTDLRRSPPSLRAANKQVPWGLDAIARKCLEFEPSKRYRQARELAEDLSRFLDDLPLKHTPEPSVRERCSKWARRNPRLCGSSSIAGASALLIIVLGGLIGLFHGNMQNLAARLQLQVFRDDLNQGRFLLNVTGGPAEHLGRGIALAQRTLDQQKVDRSGGWQSGSWVSRLSWEERTVVGAETSELILMTARAKLDLAQRYGSKDDVAKATEWAVRWLDRAESLDPDPPASLFGDRARYLAALGRDQRAASDLAKEARTTPTTARDFTVIGSARLAQGDLSKAEEALRKAVAIDPKSFWSWFALGHCHFEQGRPLDAAGDFTACVVLEPKFAWPFLNRGLALARAGRLTEARDAYIQALTANPSFAEAWLNLGLVALELNDLAGAERALSKALDLGARGGPGMLAAWAEVKARLGRRDEADALFSRLLGDRPNDPEILTARGVFRIATDPVGARSDFQKSLSARPRNARAHYGLALLLRKDDPRGALIEAESALRDDPDFLDALQARAVLRGRLGDLAAIGDAERLCQVATPHRLYNAACALSLLVEKAGEARLANRAVDLLDRALDAGFPAHIAAADPDLAPLRGSPSYRAAIDKKRASAVVKP